MTPSAEDLADLAAKYTELVRLRERRDALAPRASMRALARRFPGSLRELDARPLDALRTRRDAAVAAIGDAGRVEEWMHPTARFHALARGALIAKRWLASASSTAGFCEKHVGDAEALAWAADLERLAPQAGGRLTVAVFARLATELAIDEAAARVLVFGRDRRETTVPGAPRRFRRP